MASAVRVATGRSSGSPDDGLHMSSNTRLWMYVAVSSKLRGASMLMGLTPARCFRQLRVRFLVGWDRCSWACRVMAAISSARTAAATVGRLAQHQHVQRLGGDGQVERDTRRLSYAALQVRALAVGQVAGPEHQAVCEARDEVAGHQVPHRREVGQLGVADDSRQQGGVATAGGQRPLVVHIPAQLVLHQYAKVVVRVGQADGEVADLQLRVRCSSCRRHVRRVWNSTSCVLAALNSMRTRGTMRRDDGWLRSDA